MPDIYCYSFVEDQPSAAVARKLVEHRNTSATITLQFHHGFPQIKHGYGEIKKMTGSFLEMAKSESRVFILTDLDAHNCAGEMIREWFSIPTSRPVSLPKEVVFRVAVREVESWVMADRIAWARYLKISEANWSRTPDQLDDPKQYLLNVVRRKGSGQRRREMLPSGTAHIGPRYNEIMGEFIRDNWSPARAAALSPSLCRAISALRGIT